jgi:hypothetical protein
MKLKVKFGRNYYGMYDLHSSAPIFSIQTSAMKYSGNFDGCVAPYGLAKSSAPLRCCIFYEHKKKKFDEDEVRVQFWMVELLIVAVPSCLT